jgi:hypothetical protein
MSVLTYYEALKESLDCTEILGIFVDLVTSDFAADKFHKDLFNYQSFVL